MIITITMNPSMDYAYFIDHFQLGHTNRFETPTKSVGGKGVNAGRTAALLGTDVLLTGFLGGEMGTLVHQLLVEEHIFELKMLKIQEETRKAITIMHDAELQTELIESGPRISAQNVADLLEIIGHQKEIELICIAGSVHTDNPNLYLEVLAYIRETISQTIPVFVDTTGVQLIPLLKSHSLKPNFIKPNIYELGDLLGKKIESKQAVKAALRHPYFQGIDYVMVSCGSDGAVCQVGHECYDIQIPKIAVTNPTGSGDASVGGFIYALQNNKPLDEMMKYAMACGMSNAQHGEVGKVNVEDVAKFVKAIRVEKI